MLGLGAGATDAEVRAAYRRLAKIHHPDRNPGDPAALATFRRITDSYAALRSAPPPRAARAVTAEPVAAVGDLAVGASAWVGPEALAVAADRRVALLAGASGQRRPSAAATVRVERRADGHHVFLPPQPAALWEPGGSPVDGIPVTGLWVGDRQQEVGADGSPLLPLRLVAGAGG